MKQKTNIPKLEYKKENDKICEITDELFELKTKYKLDFDEDFNIVKLTKNNVNIIEELVQKENIQFAQMIYDYYKLNNKSLENDKDALNAVIRMIDYENKTQAYRMHRKVYEALVDAIWTNRESFWKKLKDGNKELPDIIINWIGNDGTKIKSLSSKLCQHLNTCLSLDERYTGINEDAYYKNDRYIRHAVLFYLDYYKLPREGFDKSKKLNNENYETLHNLLDKLKEKVKKEGLTRREIDHIIWYCYKSFKADL